MIAHWLFFFLINGIVAYSSYCAAGYLGRRGESLALIVTAAALCYFAQITLTILVLGVVAQTLNLFSLTMLNLALSAALIHFLRGHRRPFLAPARRWLGELLAGRDYTLYAVVALFAVQAAILLAKIIVLPPSVWDSFAYHLPPAVEWYQQGRIPLVLDIPVNRANSQALGMTVLNYWFFIPLQDDRLVELPQFLWALLLVPVVYAMLRQSAVGRDWAVKFAILVFFVPIVLMQSTTTQDHLALNVATLAALLFMAESIKTWEPRPLLLAALAFGLALGYKMSAPLHVALALAVFAGFVFVHNRAVFVTADGRRTLAKTLALGLAVMTALGGYWYIRNLALYGNVQGITHTEVVLEFSADVDADADSEAEVAGEAPGFAMAEQDKERLEERTFLQLFHLGSLAKNIGAFLPRVFDYQSLYGADLPGHSGFGPQFAAFGLPAMLLALAAPFVGRWRADPANLYAWSALGLLLAYFSFYFSNNNYRLLSFLPMVMIAYGAVFAHRQGWLDRGVTRPLVNVSILASMAWSLGHVLPPQYTNLAELREFASLEPAYRTSGRYTRWFAVHRPNMYRLISRIPAGEPIAVITQRRQGFPGEVGDDVWSYTYYDHKWRRRLRHLHQPHYLDCDRRHVCVARDELRARLSGERISLVSVCKVNYCLKIAAADFIELAPGLYYFVGQRHEQ